MAKYYRTNDRIQATTLRVIGPDGVQLGILSRDEALSRARGLGLELVEVAHQTTPPVAKIVDFNKFKYEESKKEQQAKKNAKEVELKELWFTPRIAEHDMQTRLRRVDEFLGDNNKILLRVKFTGREMAHREYGPQVMDRIMGFLGDKVMFEREPKFEGRSYTAIIGVNRAPKIEPKEQAAAVEKEQNEK